MADFFSAHSFFSKEARSVHHGLCRGCALRPALLSLSSLKRPLAFIMVCAVVASRAHLLAPLYGSPPLVVSLWFPCRFPLFSWFFLVLSLPPPFQLSPSLPLTLTLRYRGISSPSSSSVSSVSVENIGSRIKELFQPQPVPSLSCPPPRIITPVVVCLAVRVAGS